MIDWQARTLVHWDTINRLSVHRFGDTALAEEAALAVIDSLRADDWKKVRSFQGKASFSSYLRSVTARLLEDFARKRFGRKQAPLWVRNFGGIWEKLYELLCLRRYSVAEAIEAIEQNVVERCNDIETAAYSLLEKIPNCGENQGLEVSFEGIENAGFLGTSLPDSFAEQKQRRELFATIFELILGLTEPVSLRHLLNKCETLNFGLNPEEKMLLKLCYQEEMTVSKAGKLLGMNRFQVHGKMRRLLKKLYQELDRAGLSEDLRQYL